MSLLTDETPNQVNRPPRVGTSLPSTCKRGDIYFLVGTVNKIYASFAVNTWTEIFSSLGPTFSGISGNLSQFTSASVIGDSSVPVVNLVQKVTTNVSSAQILDCFNTPIPILSAPGANKVVFPIVCDVLYNFVTQAYSSGVGGTNNCRFVWGGDTTIALGSNLLSSYTQTVSKFTGQSSLLGISFNLSSVVNKALTVQEVNAANRVPTGGDGTFRIFTYYVTLDCS